MAVREIRLLHVEDDEIQRRLLRAILEKLPGYRFQTSYAASEDTAVEAFRSGSFDLVLLDYTLTSGNGLNCLKRLRQLDKAVPIIAVSGVASPETAAELVGAGADDFFSKSAIDPKSLGLSLIAALARADAWRNRAPDVDAHTLADLSDRTDKLGTLLRERLGAQFLSLLDEFEGRIRESGATAEQLHRAFEAAALRHHDESGATRALLRPMLLELVVRVFDDPSVSHVVPPLQARGT